MKKSKFTFVAVLVLATLTFSSIAFARGHYNDRSRGCNGYSGQNYYNLTDQQRSSLDQILVSYQDSIWPIANARQEKVRELDSLSQSGNLDQATANKLSNEISKLDNDLYQLDQQKTKQIQDSLKIDYSQASNIIDSCRRSGRGHGGHGGHMGNYSNMRGNGGHHGGGHHRGGGYYN